MKNQGHKKGGEWHGQAYYTPASHAEDPESERAKRIVMIRAAMRAICRREFDLVGTIDSYSPQRGKSQPEQDTALAETLSSKCLVLAYLYPGATRAIRTVELADGLGIPVFIAYEEGDGPALRRTLNLENVKEHVELVGEDGIAFMQKVLRTTLEELRGEFRQERRAQRSRGHVEL